MNSSVIKWVFVSTQKWFYDRRSNIELFFEGQDRDINKLSEVVEFRIRGPEFYERQNGRYRIELGINLLITINANKNIHRIHEIAGIFLPCFTTVIPVENFSADPDARLFCLTRESSPVRYQFLGQTGNSVKRLQAVLRSDYYAEV